MRTILRSCRITSNHSPIYLRIQLIGISGYFGRGQVNRSLIVELPTNLSRPEGKDDEIPVRTGRFFYLDATISYSRSPAIQDPDFGVHKINLCASILTSDPDRNLTMALCC